MSYQVLARKWRPQQFSELLGQQHVKSALSNALTSERLHHAYLFTGTRGVGKTTIARIFAKSLNCEQGVSATPCGRCSSCQEIEAGRFVDLLEIDAASRTKVEDTRDLLDNVQYAPTRGRFKVYLIDEVHMLSRHSFNALLKTLEEPPPHVKFLLATTDPQKLPVTVLSRCLQFSLKALTEAEIQQQLTMVLQYEEVSAEQEALVLLAKAARGSVRDALSLTDQAIAQTNGSITAPAVRDMLGLLPQHWGQHLLQAILQQDVAMMRQQLDELMLQSSQPEQVLDDILSLLHFAAISQFQPDAAGLAAEQAAFVTELAATQSAETLQLYYQLLISGKRELPYAPDSRSGLEMALLRALLFVPASADMPTTASTPRSGRNGGNRMGSASMATTAKPAASPMPALSGPAELPVTKSPASPSEGAVPDSLIEPEPEPLGEAETTAIHQMVAATETTAEQPVAAAITEPPMDAITASIMARRGVQLPPSGSARAVVASPAAKQSANSTPQQVSLSAKVEHPDFVSASEQPRSLAPEPVHAATDNHGEDAGKKPERPQAQQLLKQELDAAGFAYRFAHQIDDWAGRIEQVKASGLYRLYLLHSVPALHGQMLELTVASSEQHLETDDFRARIEQLVLAAFPEATAVQIRYQPEVASCPRDIQQQLDQARYRYAEQVMQQDPVLQTLRQNLAADFIEGSLVVN